MIDSILIPAPEEVKRLIPLMVIVARIHVAHNLQHQIVHHYFRTLCKNWNRLDKVVE